MSCHDATLAPSEFHALISPSRGTCHRSACQCMRPKQPTYGLPQLIIVFGTSKKWGIDAIGPFPRIATGKEYIIVGVDYMPRYAEATPSSRITTKDVAKFVLNNMCYRFGTPLKIISNRGPGSRANLVMELMIKLGIKHRHSTPYYPQCNGLVEKINGMICKIISKHVGDKTQHWDKHLNVALWA